MLPVEGISERILTVRGKKVILASDLAEMYGVATKALNQAVKRNAAKFPADFAFQLTREEAKVASRLRSQFVTLKRGQHLKYLPHVFTEHGAIMAATVLNSPEAVQMSVFVVRAFIKMREALISRSELERRLLQIENVLLAYDESIRELYDQIRPLLLPAPTPPKKRIGFEVKESAGRYGKEGKRK
ncbi:MAG: ORF6N domain-containing protein [Syntrophales bacterium LBB04]|nr:ORF6N domain-containing protein [Syntrophales bacterium LBB04]